jgi:apolipoprotein N-acyltransferase
VASLAVFALALQRTQRLGQAAWRGWLFSLSWLACTLAWLFTSMHTYGGLPAWMAVLAVLALAGGIALIYAGAAVMMAAFAPSSRGAQVVLFAAIWTMAELARGSWFTGLPWGAGGYAHTDLMGSLAPWIGVYGLGALAAMLAYSLAALVHPLLFKDALAAASKPAARRAGADPAAWLNRLVGLAMIGLVGGLFWGEPLRDLALADTRDNGSLRVWLLQGNIAQNEKFETGKGVAQAMSWYPAQIAEAQAAVKRNDPNAPQLVVAPETALPLLPQQMPTGDFWRPLLRSIADQPTDTSGKNMAALVGLPLGAFETGYTNSAWGITREAAKKGLKLVGAHPDGSYLQPGGGGKPGAGFYRYSKNHLVPFGEFIPPWFRWFTDLMHIPLGDFDRGGRKQDPWEYADQRIAPNICYEDLFGEELAAGFEAPSKAPTVLVNLSNIAWFGDQLVIDQHLQISRMRAMELGRPMLRATNTGATAVIDHRGTVTHLLPRSTRGRLEATVNGRVGSTPYAQWASAEGLRPAWLACASVLALALLLMLFRMGHTMGAAD